MLGVDMHRRIFEHMQLQATILALAKMVPCFA